MPDPRKNWRGSRGGADVGHGGASPGYRGKGSGAGAGGEGRTKVKGKSTSKQREPGAVRAPDTKKAPPKSYGKRTGASAGRSPSKTATRRAAPSGTDKMIAMINADKSIKANEKRNMIKSLRARKQKRANPASKTEG